MVGVALPAYKRDLANILTPFLAQDVSNTNLYISLDLLGLDGAISEQNLKEYQKSFKSIIVEKTVAGLVNNTFNALNMAFKDECDYVLYLEDDLEVSNDIISLVNYLVSIDSHDHPPFCLCNLDSGNDTSKIVKKSEFIGWGFLMHKQTFELIREHWFIPPMWDLSIAKYLNSNFDGFVFPDVSRIKHVGIDGVHIQNKELNEDIQKRLIFYDGENTNNNYYIE